MATSFSITPGMLSTLGLIERHLGKVDSFPSSPLDPKLRRACRVASILGSLTIEGRSLSPDDIASALAASPSHRAAIPFPSFLTPEYQRQEILNQNGLYEQIDTIMKSTGSEAVEALKQAHAIMLENLISDAGQWRSNHSTIREQVELQLNELFTSLENYHPLIKGPLFIYLLELIHPFSAGNNRLGRFWQVLLLSQYHSIFKHVPLENHISLNRKNYYGTLEQWHHQGNPTALLELSLKVILEALEVFLGKYRPTLPLPNARLITAQSHYINQWFSRKQYMKLHMRISTATASRDLKNGIDSDLLQSRGDKATTRYSFL